MVNMNENTLDWIIYKILMLEIHSQQHSHYTGHELIGGSYLPKRSFSQSPLQDLEKEKDHLEQTINQFNQFKQTILFSPNPIKTMTMRLEAVNNSIMALKMPHPPNIEEDNEIKEEIKEEINERFSHKQETTMERLKRLNKDDDD